VFCDKWVDTMPKSPNFITRSVQIAFALWLSLLGFSAFATASELASTNDLRKRSDSVYEVSGIDPFFIVEIDSKASVSGELIVDLGKQVSDIKLELFFKSRDSIFDPYYKASYLIDRFPTKLKLPASAITSNKLRIDLVDCPSCQIDLSSAINSDESLTSSAPLEPIELLSGLKELNPKGQVLALSDWNMNDLDGTLEEFEIAAGDPFFVSPKLASSTKGLAGVFFKLSAPNSKEAWDDYQFFYQTEHHGFNVKASANMRVSQGPNKQDFSSTELFIPLNFLSEDFPPSKSLEQIRLDLPLIDGKWALIESKLVHESELEQYSAARPKQLIHTKLQRATGLRLLKKSFFNVLADRGFVIAYLLLIITVIALLLRAYRRYD